MATPTQLKGSFRGVPFGLFAHTMESGRRVAVHEFPYRDTPYAEDLGLRMRSFALDMFVVGDDVAKQRDALIKALEQKGAGTLIHPYLGSMQVAVSGFTVGESVNALRLANFSVSFIQAGKLEFPKASANPVGAVSAASTSASIQAGTQAGKMDLSLPAAAQAITTIVSSLADAVQTSARKAALPNSLATVIETSDAIEKMSTFMSDCVGLPSLASTPDVMSFALADVIFRIGGLGLTSLQAFYAYARLLTDVQTVFDALRYPGTPIGEVMAANAALLRDVALISIVSSATVAAVDADFATFDQAIGVRMQLAAMYDAVTGQLTHDELFGHLQDLQASSLTQIPRPGMDLPNVVRMRCPAPLPAIVLAYDLMKGASDEQTIIDLNGARNPWFVPTGPKGSVLVLR